MEWIFQPEAWAALLTLTALEIVLGIDNIIFISILVNKLPAHARKNARIIGLSIAMLTRILLLLTLTTIMKLTAPFFSVFDIEISGRDLVLIGGGLFLLAKATIEIHNALEVQPEHADIKAAVSFLGTVLQIGIIDIVFSLDSVITAVGMAQHLQVMIIAIILAVGVMMLASHSISEFVDQHPTIKMLALSFLVLIGVALIADALDVHVPKGYIYFAMGFSFMVEMLNIRLRRKQREPLALYNNAREQSEDVSE